MRKTCGLGRTRACGACFSVINGVCACADPPFEVPAPVLVASLVLGVEVCPFPELDFPCDVPPVDGVCVGVLGCCTWTAKKPRPWPPCESLIVTATVRLPDVL